MKNFKIMTLYFAAVGTYLYFIARDKPPMTYEEMKTIERMLPRVDETTIGTDWESLHEFCKQHSCKFDPCLTFEGDYDCVLAKRDTPKRYIRTDFSKNTYALTFPSRRFL